MRKSTRAVERQRYTCTGNMLKVVVVSQKLSFCLERHQVGVIAILPIDHMAPLQYYSKKGF